MISISWTKKFELSPLEVTPVPNQVGKFAIGRFEKDLDDIQQWLGAISNNPESVNYIYQLIRHEYVESKLVLNGMPYLSLSSLPDGNVLNYGAHTLSPNFTSNYFSHWSTLNRSTAPTMNNDLDQLVNQIINFEKL